MSVKTEPKVVEIDHDGLLALLLTAKGATFVSVTSTTVPKLIRQKSNKYNGRLKKRATVRGIIGYNYENGVNNQRAREGKEADFEAQERSWGERATSVIVEYKDREYISVRVQETLNKTFILDGVEVHDPEIIKDIEANVYKPPKPANQGTDKPIIVNDITLTNINAIRMHNTAYQVHRVGYLPVDPFAIWTWLAMAQREPEPV